MKIFSPSIVRAERPLEIGAQLLNALGCQSVHIDISFDMSLPGLYGKEILAAGKLHLFNCPATIHIFSNAIFRSSSLEGVRGIDTIMLHIFPTTGSEQIAVFLDCAAQIGCHSALALDLEADISLITPFISGLRAVYLMGIPVATHSLPPDSLTLGRMKILRAAVQKHSPSSLLGIDGGINNETFSDLTTGADEIVIGGLLFNSPNIYSQWAALNGWLEKIDGGVHER